MVGALAHAMEVVKQAVMEVVKAHAKIHAIARVEIRVVEVQLMLVLLQGGNYPIDFI